jgi:hypothetical protein
VNRRVSTSRSRIFLCFFCFLCLLGFPALAVAPEPALVRFAVIGDSGTGDAHQYAVAREMLRWHDRRPFELVLMLGDNIYGAYWGGGNRKDFEAKFDKPYAGLLARGVVFRAALGNHDLRARDGRDLVESYDRFHIERPEGFYSFTAGEWFPAAGAPRLRSGQAAGLSAREDKSAPLVEFFVINTVRLEKDKKDPEQLAWLDKALAASRARWRVVYGHHPLYSTGKHHGPDVRMRAKLEPLFFDAAGRPRVHVVLAGHDHIYQRFVPQKGIVYLVCGSSGKLRRGNARPSALVAAVEDRRRAFMLWEATPDELRFRAINEQGQAFDCGALREAEVVAAACPAD